jgi:hypothetical protein
MKLSLQCAARASVVGSPGGKIRQQRRSGELVLMRLLGLEACWNKIMVYVSDEIPLHAFNSSVPSSAICR